MRPSHDLPVDDLGVPMVTLSYLIKQVELVSRARLDEIVAAEGLSTSEYTALTVLGRRHGLTTSDLARNSFVRPQSMAELIGSLEQRDLISRAPDAENRRRMIISLTAAGRALLGRLRKPVEAMEEEMTSGLSPAKRAALSAALESCRVALSGARPH